VGAGGDVIEKCRWPSIRSQCPSDSCASTRGVGPAGRSCRAWLLECYYRKFRSGTSRAGPLPSTPDSGSADHSGPLDRERSPSLDGPRDGKPPVAAPFRPWDCGNNQRLWQERYSAEPSRLTRLARYTLCGGEVEHKGHAPADAHLERLQTVISKR